MRTLKTVRVLVLAASCALGLMAMMTPGQALAKKPRLGAAEIEELKELLKYVKVVPSGVDGKPTLLVTGANVQIESGATGAHPEQEVNGEGNLVIGYNESPPAGKQTGSNNLVLGTSAQTFTSYGSLIAGLGDADEGPNSDVFGHENLATGDESSVTGGSHNEATHFGASVSGGTRNKAAAEKASVSGGELNRAEQSNASVSGGIDNAADARDASIAGGNENLANGLESSISGGLANQVIGEQAVILGGELNTIEAAGVDATIIGESSIKLKTPRKVGG